MIRIKRSCVHLKLAETESLDIFRDVFIDASINGVKSVDVRIHVVTPADVGVFCPSFSELKSDIGDILKLQVKLRLPLNKLGNIGLWLF
ncbi:hypothetical protein HK096_000929 [Nowakowskiella sp. JEL0078]|nr:hypothetical protein HK096_000929 [Nowakowskiella sp. JEL0078]